MTTETINGLHSCKPENVPVMGDVKTFVIEHRPAKNGKKAWIKIKSAGPDYGGEPYLILSASPTGFTDQHGNISFNLEIEPADHPTKGNYPPDARYDTPEKATRNAPQAPPERPMSKDDYWQRKLDHEIAREPHITRMHSQSMALALMELKSKLGELTVEDLTPAKLRALADYFDSDVLGAAQ